MKNKLIVISVMLIFLFGFAYAADQKNSTTGKQNFVQECMKAVKEGTLTKEMYNKICSVPVLGSSIVKQFKDAVKKELGWTDQQVEEMLKNLPSAAELKKKQKSTSNEIAEMKSKLEKQKKNIIALEAKIKGSATPSTKPQADPEKKCDKLAKKIKSIIDGFNSLKARKLFKQYKQECGKTKNYNANIKKFGDYGLK